MSTRGVLARRRARAVLAIASLLVATSCGSSQSNASSTSLSRRPSTPATLEITAPAPNALTGRTVDLTMQLDHARLVPPIQVGGRIVGDRGHIHVLVDGQLVAMPFRLTDPLPTLTPGVHTVQAEFVASDHLPFENRVVAAVTFRVR